MKIVGCSHSGDNALPVSVCHSCLSQATWAAFAQGVKEGATSANAFRMVLSDVLEGRQMDRFFECELSRAMEREEIVDWLERSSPDLADAVRRGEHLR